MSSESGEDILQHWGILGMKWGKRKAGSDSGGSSTSSKSKKPQGKSDTTGDEKRKTSKDFDLTEAIKKKKVSELSNDEIRALQIRMQLEREFNNMTETPSDKRKREVLSVLETSAKTTLGTYATKWMGMGMDFAQKKVEGKIAENAAKKAADLAKNLADEVVGDKLVKDVAEKVADTAKSKVIDEVRKQAGEQANSSMERVLKKTAEKFARETAQKAAKETVESVVDAKAKEVLKGTVLDIVESTAQQPFKKAAADIVIDGSWKTIVDATMTPGVLSLPATTMLALPASTSTALALLDDIT